MIVGCCVSFRLFMIVSVIDGLLMMVICVGMKLGKVWGVIIRLVIGLEVL